MGDLSDLSIDRKECSKCGAIWLNQQHYWATGSKGNELDLAGLVCNQANSKECINPRKGEKGGDTWDKRLEFLKTIEKKIEGPQWDAGINGID